MFRDWRRLVKTVGGLMKVRPLIRRGPEDRAYFLRVFRVVLMGLAFSPVVMAGEGPYFATGVKVGEVTPNEAILWARLTRTAERVGVEGGIPKVLYLDAETGEWSETSRRPDRKPKVVMPTGRTVETLEGAAPGAPGDVRLSYRPAGGDWTVLDWAAVDPKTDFTYQVRLTGLKPATRYEFRFESRPQGGIEPAEAIDGGFRTAPKPGAPVKVRFVVTTCFGYPDLDAPGKGFKIYPAIQDLHPDFFVHTGDILYYDKLAKTLPLARWHWQRTYSLPYAVEFHRFVPAYFMKDDHDTWKNDCWPGEETQFMGDFTFEQGQAVFLEQAPIGQPTYRTFRWGKDLQIWLVEGRDYRTPNAMPDGPEKTIWGEEQKAWFKRTVDESDASFRVLISPTPLVGPDRVNKNDNHSNRGFKHEGDELREFLASRKNMVVMNGDRHWQYCSVDEETGLHEYGCGAASTEHAGGWKQEDFIPEHRYLNVIGGFLYVEVARKDGEPVMTIQHRGVDGNVLNEDVFTAVSTAE